MKDPFAVLGLAAGATVAEVRAAFWARARTMHPDRHPEDPRANERFRRVVLAYEEAVRVARGLPARRRERVHHASAGPASHAAPPPVWRCPSCGDGYGYEDACPRCEIVVSMPAAPPAAQALAGAAVAIGLVVMVAGLRPFALGAMLVMFGAFVLGLALHERLRPALAA